MSSKRTLILFACTALVVGGAYYLAGGVLESATREAHAEEKHGHEEKKAEEGHDDGAEISKESMELAGIKTAVAGNATIHETVRLSGRTMLNQNATAQVKARFPGIVRSIKKNVGEMVAAGDVLATVESNESLQVYSIKSPISGVVLMRSTNVGDVAGEEPIFTITNTSTIWAEFHVFPRDIDQIKIGQKILIQSFEGGHKSEAKVSALLPVAEASSQTVLARVNLPNEEGVWRAGMTIRGDVVTTEHAVPVAVKTSALQNLEGRDVVFVEENGRYETRPVTLGAGDEEWTEIRDGLQAGESYVSEKSFQVKAEIGKAAAGHEH